jgi:hypothetical protein
MITIIMALREEEGEENKGEGEKQGTMERQSKSCKIVYKKCSTYNTISESRTCQFAWQTKRCIHTYPGYPL